MRVTARVVVTVAGVLVVLACLGSVGSAIAEWTSTQTCGGTGRDHFCVTTGPGSGLSHGPWTYMGVGLALLLLAVCLFTLRERIRTRS